MRKSEEGKSQQSVSYTTEVVNAPEPAKRQPVEIKRDSNRVPPKDPSGRKAGLLVGIVILALLIAGAVTIVSKFSEKNALAAETEKLAIPTVSVTHPTQEQSHEELVLPATIQAYKESPIYART